MDLKWPNIKDEEQQAYANHCALLDISLPANRIDEIYESGSFADMKKNTSTFSPASDQAFFKSGEELFCSGRTETIYG